MSLSPRCRPRPARRSARSWTLPILLVTVLAAGCAPTGGDPAPQPEGDPTGGERPTTQTDDATFPLTLDNCGFEVTVDEAPQRVVTIKSSTLELMLALGLGDRVVGAAFLDGPVPADYTAAADRVEVIADAAPGQEAVLTMEPDLVFAGWESNFAADSAGDRAALDALGVATYVAPSACKEPGYMPDPLTFEDVFAEITQAGTIFGVPDAAEALVAKQRDALEQVVRDSSGTTALWYSSGEDVPYVGAGIGAPQMIMDAVGLTNIAADVHDTWTPLGWEQIVADDPDVIVLVDALWNTAANKIDLLESHPATSQLTAVREGRYLTIPFPATEAGVRNVAAVEDLVVQLADLKLAP